jgi:ankyrin repeat protein
MMACSNSSNNSNNDTVKLLLDYKADINIQNNDRFTAMIISHKYNGISSSSETIHLIKSYMNKENIKKECMVLYNLKQNINDINDIINILLL